MATPMAPYYERYDPTKKYVQQLAIPGRVAQASEWNDMGAMNLDFLRRMGDAMFTNGNIIDGCDIAINGNEITITQGRIYLDGIVHEVDETTLIIEGAGTENICAYVDESIVTEAQDTSLYDPAAGAENYGQPGVHMRKRVVRYGINIEGAPIIYKLEDGVLSISAEGNNEFAVITDILARRTYDESGNYRVSGLQMSEKGIEDEENIHISLSAGKCYVLGYEVTKPTDTTFMVKKAKSIREITGESVPHSVANTNKIYDLANHPVQDIYQLTVTVAITENMTRGAIRGGIDYIPHTPVFEIDEVSQGDTVFVRGTDWQRSGDTVDWSLLGKEPEIGSTYTIKYRYNYTLTPSEYELIVDEVNGKSSVRITNELVVPVTDSLVYFNYGFYLARMDLISIDKTGRIIVTEGEPEVLRNARLPVVTDETILNIGSITVPANQSHVQVVNMSIETSTMDDIQKTVKRVDALEYNQAVSDLDEEAMDGEPATELQGILTDGFIGFSKCDLTHPEFDASIDIDAEELILPFNENIRDITINGGNYDTVMGEMGVVVTTPYTEEIQIDQPYATRPMLVNPYAVFDPVVPITLNPSVDNWIDYDQITVRESNTVTHRTSAGTLSSWWNNSASRYFDDLSKVTRRTTNNGKTGIYTSTDETSRQTAVRESIVTYMRPREVTLTSTGFAPNADNIWATFDDRPIALTPLAPTTRGTKEGTVRADSKGNITCVFNVPENVPCGTKAVKVFFDGDGLNAGKSGQTTYTAEGRLHTTVTTIFQEVVQVTVVDPLAQTFQLDEEHYLTSVDLYFAQKDPQTPVVVQCRNVVNGYPGAVCYGQVVLPADEINVSQDASAVTIAKFQNAVKLKENTQYCIVVMSDSPLPALWVAKLGEVDIQTNSAVTSNPYIAGVLFSSSNALTWTAHQDMDMKIKIKTAKFSDRGSIIFNDVPVSAADSLVLAVDAVVPTATTLKWYFKLPGGAWQMFDIYDEVALTTVASVVSIKCEFTGQPNRAPMVSTMCMSLATFLNKSTGTYVSKNVNIAEKYNDLKVYLDVATPQGSSFKVFYTTNEGISWEELKVSEATPSTVDEEFIRYYWHKTGLGEQENFRVKIVLETTNVINSPRAKRLMCIMKTV